MYKPKIKNNEQSKGYKRIKEIEGITLIALVITIIVLLILAGVSIAMLTEGDGILSQSAQSKEVTNLETAKEKLRIAMSQLMIDKNSSFRLVYLNELADKESKNYNEGIIINEKIKEKDRVAKVIVYGYEFNVDKNGNIVDESNSWDGKTVSKGLYGLGTQEQPFLIQNIEDFAYMRNQVNSTESTIYSLTDNNNYNTAKIAYYELTNDIKCNSIIDISRIDDWSENPPQNEWIPIGENEKSIFSGVFDGKGHQLIGFYICGKEDESYKAIFGQTRDAKIKNLNLIDSYISGECYVAGIVANLDCTSMESAIVDNCSLQGRSYILGKGAINQRYGNIGGVVGHAESGVRIYNCYNTSVGFVKFEGILGVNDSHGFVGGILGGGSSNNICIYNCYNTCEIICIFYDTARWGSTGGIVGQIAYSDIFNSYNTGTIYCEIDEELFNVRVYGVAGMGRTNNCYNYGTVNEVGENQTITKEELKNLLNNWVDSNNIDNRYKKWEIIENKNNGYPILIDAE